MPDTQEALHKHLVSVEQTKLSTFLSERQGQTREMKRGTLATAKPREGAGSPQQLGWPGKAPGRQDARRNWGKWVGCKQDQLAPGRPSGEKLQAGNGTMEATSQSATGCRKPCRGCSWGAGERCFTCGLSHPGPGRARQGARLRTHPLSSPLWVCPPLPACPELAVHLWKGEHENRTKWKVRTAILSPGLRRPRLEEPWAEKA